MPTVYEEMDLSVWSSLGRTAWKGATPKEQVFLAFCMAFDKVSGEPTETESHFWDLSLEAESEIRGYLVENDFQIVKQEDFDLSHIADGMLKGRVIRAVQAHYGISICGGAFTSHSREENERKYQKAIKISERLAMIGCSSQDNLPYFNAQEHLERV